MSCLSAPDWHEFIGILHRCLPVGTLANISRLCTLAKTRPSCEAGRVGYRAAVKGCRNIRRAPRREPTTECPSRLSRSSPPIALAEVCEAEWECVAEVGASLAASLLSLRLLVVPHNRLTLLMRESVDKKLLSCSLAPWIQTINSNL